MAIPISERIGDPGEFYRLMLEGFGSNLRVAAPGIIDAFDATTQTATVQIAIRERIANDDLTSRWTEIPLLLDVPIVIPRAGGFAMTLPVKKGDECLVVFGDMCIDAWYECGGVQNQIEKRRHDLSDAFAILGPWSQPRKLPNYATDAAQLRTDDGSAYVSIKPSGIDIVAPAVRINGIDFGAHTHVAPNGGGQTSGPS